MTLNDINFALISLQA